MNNYTEIIDLVHKKAELFLEIEKTTDAMSVVPTEELLQLSELRGNLIEKMKVFDEIIESICKADSEIKTAYNHTCNREDLTPELLNVYIEALELKAIANRIIKNEDVIRDRIEFEKQKLLSKIKSFNQSGTAVTDKYYKTVKGIAVSDAFPKNNIKV